MRYQVPQNIDMEDKIVGPLTLPQFIYLMFGGMIIYLSYQALYFSTQLLFFIIAAPTALLSLSLAFLKVQEEPFPKFLASLLVYLVRPKKRVWSKGGGEEKIVIKKNPPKQKLTTIPHRTFSSGELQEVSRVLDSSGKTIVEKVPTPPPPPPIGR